MGKFSSEVAAAAVGNLNNFKVEAEMTLKSSPAEERFKIQEEKSKIQKGIDCLLPEFSSFLLNLES